MTIVQAKHIPNEETNHQMECQVVHNSHRGQQTQIKLKEFSRIQSQF